MPPTLRCLELCGGITETSAGSISAYRSRSIAGNQKTEAPSLKLGEQFGRERLYLFQTQLRARSFCFLIASRKRSNLDAETDSPLSFQPPPIPDPASDPNQPNRNQNSERCDQRRDESNKVLPRPTEGFGDRTAARFDDRRRLVDIDRQRAHRHSRA